MQNNQEFFLDFSSIRYFKLDKSNIEILVGRVEKMKKVDFAISFCCFDAIFLISKKNNKNKAEKPRKRQYFSVFLSL